MDDFGFTRKTIDALEAPMESFTLETVVERLDEVFNKNWSYSFEGGPELIYVPKEVPKIKSARNPKVFKTIEVAHWRCSCSISIGINEVSDIVREYTVLVPASEDGSFCVARDLSLIYTAYYGLRVGKKSDVVFEDSNQVPVELQLGGGNDEVQLALKELSDIKARMGIHRNVELDPLVREFNPELKSHKNITRSNLRDFTNFLRNKEGNGS